VTAMEKGCFPAAILLALLTLLCRPAAAELAGTLTPHSRWAAYYNDKATMDELAPYQLLVLDTLHHPAIPPLKDRGKVLLGYLSLGEAEQHRPSFQRLKRKGVLLEENPNWPGSFFVDVRDPFWTSLVIEELIPAILRQGFDGLFLDTLDNPPHLEASDPARHKGITKAPARLVRAIRRHYPSIPIMLNRGFDLWQETADAVDMVLVESFQADYDFEAKEYRLVPDDEQQWVLARVKELRALRPDIPVFSLDYWPPGDTGTVRELYRRARGLSMIPYVATVELDRLVAEPEPGHAP